MDSKNTLNTLDRIKARESKLHGKKRDVAKYIIDSYREVAFLTLAELAADTGTSKATVLRLAQELGFQGYQEMQESIQNELKKELNTIDLYSGQQSQNKGETILRKVFIKDLEVIEQTLEQLDYKSFDDLTSKIIEADQIAPVATGELSFLAELLASVLRPMLSNVKAITSTSYLGYRELATLDSNSLVIALDIPRYSKSTISLVKTANQLDLTTVVITDSNLSPFHEYSDQLLNIAVKRVTWIDSLSGILSTLQAIATDVSIKTKTETLEKLEKVEQVWEENDVFF
ncbi:MurR/RpiR family transcriptional regulator [Candidatus Bipolaricaulota bacterium]|nr:MurR/RpiR family transcriptional regulator [Candidatus Bipolaricaulota bacterium]